MKKYNMNKAIETFAEKTFSYSNIFDYKPHKLIYHYTSPTGLLGILGNEEVKFYFTRYDCVNDTTEGKNVLDCYKEACNELFNEKAIDDNSYRLISNINIPETKRFFYRDEEQNYFGSKEEYKAYICCFSTKRDSLPMWNYYVKNGLYQGYNIGFESNIFSIRLKKDYENKFQIVKVIYNQREKVDILKKFILDHFNTYKTIDLLVEKGLISFIEDFLFKAHLVYKSNYFLHENEVRAIMYVPQKKDDNNQEFEVHFREHNGYIIPYIEVNIKMKGHIREVIIGPLVEKEVSHSTVQSLLNQRGYEKAEIINSKIPIRF